MLNYRHEPLQSTQTPPGIPFIILNQAAEKFSYYGMQAILVVFMTQYLLNEAGQLDLMSEDEAKGYFHLFSSVAMLTPLFGAILADCWLGKFKTVIFLSLIYCMGHLILATDDTRVGLMWGLGLIAVGSGGILPCVATNVGDQFGRLNQHLLSKTFGWFYAAINIGAFLSILITPWLLENHSPSVAFGVPGILMLIATLTYWLGRFRFTHIPPVGLKFFESILSRSGLRTLGKLLVIYAFVAIFWALFAQTGSSWVLQAQQMDRVIFGYTLLPSQIQAANPLLIILLIPVFTYLIYPAINHFIPLTALRKMSVGFFFTTLAFTVSYWIQTQIDMGLTPPIAWQLLAYVVLTSSEVMVSITCLEFSYTQAPKSMKSLIMALFFLSISMGNLLTSSVNFFIQNPDGSSMLTGADYYLFFVLLMLVVSVLFMGVAKFYPAESPSPPPHAVV